MNERIFVKVRKIKLDPFDGSCCSSVKLKASPERWRSRPVFFCPVCGLRWRKIESGEWMRVKLWSCDEDTERDCQALIDCEACGESSTVCEVQPNFNGTARSLGG